MSVMKAQLQQRFSNIYIYLYVRDQSGYTGSERHMKNFGDFRVKANLWVIR